MIFLGSPDRSRAGSARSEPGPTLRLLEHLTVETPDRLGRTAREQSQPLAVPQEERTEPLRNRQCDHPVRDRLEEFLRQTVAPERELLRMATRAEPRLATEGDQKLRTAARTRHPGEAVIQDPATQVLVDGPPGEEATMRRARRFQETVAFRAAKRRRQVVEHRIARLRQLGVVTARYRGRAKTLFQLLIAATVANLTLVAAVVGSSPFAGDLCSAWRHALSVSLAPMVARTVRIDFQRLRKVSNRERPSRTVALAA